MLLLVAASLAAEGIYPLDGVTSETPDAELAPFAEVIGDADVVALGESRHCGGGYLEAKARLVRWLVETQGFRLVTIESPWVWGLTATEYVATGQGDAQAAMRSFFAAFHDSETLAMLEWLAAWNVAHPEDPVRFYGFDVQDALPMLTDYLGGHGVSDAEIAACEAGPCEVASEDPWVRLAARTITIRHQLDANRGTPFGAYGDVRDLGMADTLLTIRGLVAPEARTIALAHNMHLMEQGSAQGRLRGGGWTDTGEHLASRLGDDYVVIGLVASDLVTSCQGAPQRQGRRDLEREIRDRARSAAALVDLGVATELAGPWKVSGHRMVAGEQYDALLWFDHARAADTGLLRGEPLASADRAWVAQPVIRAVHRTGHTEEEEERLWAAYLGWMDRQLGCAPEGRRRHTLWDRAKWQPFSCARGGAEVYLWWSRREDAWQVSIRREARRRDVS